MVPMTVACVLTLMTSSAVKLSAVSSAHPLLSRLAVTDDTELVLPAESVMTKSLVAGTTARSKVTYAFLESM